MGNLILFTNLNLPHSVCKVPVHSYSMYMYIGIQTHQEREIVFPAWRKVVSVGNERNIH